MSLSSWFRDYVYIPLGGNRVTAPRHIVNILLVWLLTGFWHGANWNFIAWGGFFGLILIAEKFGIGKALARCGKIIPHVYVLLIVGVSWVLFDAPTLSAAGETLSRMFGFGADSFAGAASLYYLRSYAVPLVIGIIGTTPIIRTLALKIEERPTNTALQPIAVIALLIVVTAFLVDGSFNPFIYFRF
jgi:alginate O-acetyltransferase complex protein AlgI